MAQSGLPYFYCLINLLEKKEFKAKLFTIWGGKCGVIISLENSIYNESIRDYFLLGYAFVFSYLLGMLCS